MNKTTNISRLNWRNRARRRVFAALLIFGSLSLGMTPQPAHAEAGGSNILIRNAQSFYAYVKTGEHLEYNFTIATISSNATYAPSITFQAKGPSYASTPCTLSRGTNAVGDSCALTAPAATSDAVWEISTSGNSAVMTSWNIGVYNGSTLKPGRVWSNKYLVAQSNSLTDDLRGDDIALYYLRNDGYLYKSVYRDYNGIDSTFIADAVGITAKSSCLSAYRSSAMFSSTDPAKNPQGEAIGYGSADAACGTRFKIFFDAPDKTMPAAAAMPDGMSDWLYQPVQPTTISNLSFAGAAGAADYSGAISFDMANYIGTANIVISVNGQDDRTIPVAINDAGRQTVVYDFDGKNRDGQIIPASATVAFRVEANHKGEIHFVNVDVEKRAGGLEVQRLTGTTASPTIVFWDDSYLIGQRCGARHVQPSANLAGVDSTGGVHSWGVDGCARIDTGKFSSGNDRGSGSYDFSSAAAFAAVSSYGNMRNIDDWTYDVGSAVVSAALIMKAPAAAVQSPTPGSPNAGFAAADASYMAIGLLLLSAGILAILTRRRARQ